MFLSRSIFSYDYKQEKKVAATAMIYRATVLTSNVQEKSEVNVLGRPSLG